MKVKKAMNLWPDNLTKPKTPLSHMYEQADNLLNKYNLDLLGERNGDVMKFRMVNAIIGVELLEIHHPESYPCKVHFDGVIKRCKTEAELLGALTWVFNHDKTKQMISELIK